MSAVDAVLSTADANLESSLERMFALCRIKSISTDPAYKQECARAASWLSDYLASLGFDASVRPTVTSSSSTNVSRSYGFSMRSVTFFIKNQ